MSREEPPSVDRAGETQRDDEGRASPESTPVPPPPHSDGHLRTLPGDRYREFKPVGQGGMGIVYWAIDSDLNREVAFKVIRPTGGTKATPAQPTELQTPGPDTPESGVFESLRQRFLQEAWITSGMAHPGIVPVYELGQTPEGIPYYTMRFIRGETTLLAAIEAARGKGMEERLALLEPFLKVCDAVRYAHARGVVHRDLKPENVALGEFGEAVVLDWGLATLPGQEEAAADPLAAHIQAFRDASDFQTIAGALGTPGYMSPEAALGDTEATGTRSDVYSLGAILFQILTGRLPHTFETFPELAMKLLKEDAPAAAEIDGDVPEALSDLCAACLARDPDARPATANAVAEAIRTWQVERERDREVQGYLREARSALENGEGLHGAELLREADRASAAVARVLVRRPASERALQYQARIDTLREAGMQERERAARKRAILRSAVAALVLLVVGAAVAVALVEDARREESRQRARASEQLLRARALGLANASAAVGTSNPELALLLACEAGRAQLLPEVVTRLHAAIVGQHDSIRFEGHEGDIRALAVSPAGDRIVSGGEDRFARVWDLEGHQLHALEHDWPVVAVAFAPDGKTLLTTSRDTRVPAPRGRGEVRLWSAAGALLQRIDGHEPSAWNALYSPSGDRILTLGYDHVARVWDLEGNRLFALEGHEHSRVTAAFSPSGDRIVTSSAASIRESRSVPCDVRMWSADGELLKTLATHGGGVRCVRWSPDGERILSCSYDSTARLYDGQGDPIAVIEEADAIFMDGYFSPTSTHVVLADWVNIRIWDRDGRLVSHLRGHAGAQRCAIDFSRTGDRVVTSALDRTVRVWNLDGQPEAVLHLGDGPAASVAFAPSGREVVAGGASLRLWDLVPRELPSLESDGYITNIRWSPDGTHMLLQCVAEDFGGWVELWSAKGKRVFRSEQQGKVMYMPLAWSADGTRFTASIGEGVARVWDIEGREVATLRHPHNLEELRFLPEGHHVLGKVIPLAGQAEDPEPEWIRWDDRGTVVDLGPEQHRPYATVAFAPDGDELLVAGAKEHAARLCTMDGTVRHVLALEGACTQAWFSRRGDVLVTIESPDTGRQVVPSRVRVWDRSGRLLHSWDPEGRHVIELAPSGDLLLGLERGGQAPVLWELDGRVRAELQGHGNTVFGAMFSEQGGRVLTCSMDSTARLWDLDGNELAVLPEHERALWVAAIDPTGTKVLTSDDSKRGLMWLVEADDVLALAERRVARPLTPAERARYADLLGD